VNFTSLVLPSSAVTVIVVSVSLLSRTITLFPETVAYLLSGITSIVILDAPVSGLIVYSFNELSNCSIKEPPVTFISDIFKLVSASLVTVIVYVLTSPETDVTNILIVDSPTGVSDFPAPTTTEVSSSGVAVTLIFSIPTGKETV